MLILFGRKRWEDMTTGRRRGRREHVGGIEESRNRDAFWRTRAARDPGGLGSPCSWRAGRRRRRPGNRCGCSQEGPRRGLRGASPPRRSSRSPCHSRPHQPRLSPRLPATGLRPHPIFFLLSISSLIAPPFPFLSPTSAPPAYSKPAPGAPSLDSIPPPPLASCGHKPHPLFLRPFNLAVSCRTNDAGLLIWAYS